MRALFKSLGLLRETGADPAVARTAAAIVVNLRALGLFVEAKRFGPHFVEIVASTSPKLIATPGSPLASGVALLLAGKFNPPTLVFEEINSLEAGLGRSDGRSGAAWPRGAATARFGKSASTTRRPAAATA